MFQSLFIHHSLHVCAQSNLSGRSIKYNIHGNLCFDQWQEKVLCSFNLSSWFIGHCYMVMTLDAIQVKGRSDLRGSDIYICAD